MSMDLTLCPLQRRSWPSHEVCIVCMPPYFHSHWNATKSGHSGQLPGQTRMVGITPQPTALQRKHCLHITANGCLHWRSMASILTQESKTLVHIQACTDAFGNHQQLHESRNVLFFLNITLSPIYTILWKHSMDMQSQSNPSWHTSLNNRKTMRFWQQFRNNCVYFSSRGLSALLKKVYARI